MTDERVAAIIPNWNGRSWLPDCLSALASQSRPFDEILVVDNGSEDDSLAYLRSEHPEVHIIEMGMNTGFARAANAGLAATTCPLVALVNSDVVLTPDWLERTTASLSGAPAAAAVACKMLSLDDPAYLYDAGDVLRRDGVCEQRGRYGRDDGRYDAPGWVFGACAGAALYRREAVLAVGGFDPRYFAYLEDVDLALKLQLAGWRCRYEPAVALHAGEGSSRRLPGGARRLMARNTLLLVAQWFPARWLPLVAYRQLAWLAHAAREGSLHDHVAGLVAGVRLTVPVVARRLRERRPASPALAVAVPPQPIRGPRALGHPSGRAR
jgi:GT2 family glycosyltransferase